MFSVVIPVIYTMLQIIIFILLGFILRRYFKWPADFFTYAGRLVMKVALPLYLFVKICRTNIADLQTSWIFFVLAIIVPFCSVMVSGIITFLIRVPKEERRISIAMGTFCNSGYLPLTIIEFLPLSLPIIADYFIQTTAVLYIGTYLLFYSPLLWSAGYYLITGKGQKISINQLITPPLLGIVAGFLVLIFRLQPLLFSDHLPFKQIFMSLNQLGNITLPLVLIVLGNLIANLVTKESQIRITKEEFYPAIVGVLTRFVIFPAFFYLFIFKIFRPDFFSPTIIWVIFLEIIIPPASNFAIMTAGTGKNEDCVALSLLVTYLIYFVVFPVHLILFLKFMGIL
ncbi:MAG: AEC family transporter [Spirochaetes bacterium]|nr:AEC family transporter [Spirochaetota bacterium]